MTRTIQQITKDLETLEQKVAIVSQESYHIYSQYLESLSAALRQQFILASYQLCTQIYPEYFLKLSYSQREQLQQNLIEISQENLQEILAEKQNITDATELAQWQENLENSITVKLDKISKSANDCLQNAKIFPEETPEQILEMAVETEENLTGINTPANLLYLLIDLAEDETETLGSIQRIAIIYLRLLDLEFSSPNLTAQRSKIREISEQINLLEQKYQKRLRELAIAEAEAAWRSSWHL
ncbi:hypothetical protein [Gloeocapsa sp. PCC 73106]|uniref:hypothetical protein n=1 Tax=Gloeocapsa sp. PCC 73106 TaxID=102232 RepID=UPI0002ACF16E|nr:hypothetical protein [Gloeocapsa sp. PCC 73106]ELR99178.1 hypothetical protein GLO73106DRAFT_00030270 [Gloeocapsa sp. PCC 73106]